MKKAIRNIVFEKYNGKCYLCGTVLKPGWHVDHLEPCLRKQKWIKPHWNQDIKGMTEEQILNSGAKYISGKWVPDGYGNPDANHIDNLMPACPSCNINKHGDSLDGFRSNIAAYMKHLNEISTQYKIAKRYGLIEETEKPVIFYFEQVSSPPQSSGQE